MPDEPIETPPTPAAPEFTPTQGHVARWIGAGLGVAAAITALVLTFNPATVEFARSGPGGPILGIVLGLGAGLLIWGLIGGLDLHIKAKFKWLGEVTGGGIGAIIALVMIVSQLGTEPVAEPTAVTYGGRVLLDGDVTTGIAGAKVVFNRPGHTENTATNSDGRFSFSLEKPPASLEVWAEKEGFIKSGHYTPELAGGTEISIGLSEDSVWLPGEGKPGTNPVPTQPSAAELDRRLRDPGTSVRERQNITLMRDHSIAIQALIDSGSLGVTAIGSGSLFPGGLGLPPAVATPTPEPTPNTSR